MAIIASVAPSRPNTNTRILPLSLLFPSAFTHNTKSETIQALHDKCRKEEGRLVFMVPNVN
jgi:hypothetical protein